MLKKKGEITLSDLIRIELISLLASTLALKSIDRE